MIAALQRLSHQPEHSVLLGTIRRSHSTGLVEQALHTCFSHWRHQPFYEGCVDLGDPLRLLVAEHGDDDVDAGDEGVGVEGIGDGALDYFKVGGGRELAWHSGKGADVVTFAEDTGDEVSGGTARCAEDEEGGTGR